VCNVAKHGKEWRIGAATASRRRQVLLDLGIGSEAIPIVEVDLRGLREVRAASDKALERQAYFRKKPGMYQPAWDWNCTVFSAAGETPLPPGLIDPMG
jgi:hypothetical protein